MQRGFIPATRNVGISFQEDGEERIRSFRYQSSNERSGVARIGHRCMQGIRCKRVDTHWLPKFRMPRDESKAGTRVSSFMSRGILTLNCIIDFFLKLMVRFMKYSTASVWLMACLSQDAMKTICRRWSDVETPSQTFIPERNRATTTETGGSCEKIMLGQPGQTPRSSRLLSVRWCLLTPTHPYRKTADTGRSSFSCASLDR